MIDRSLPQKGRRLRHLLNLQAHNHKAPQRKNLLSSHLLALEAHKGVVEGDRWMNSKAYC